jgi:hypothetical protein
VLRIELTALDGNNDAGIDQRSHGFRRTRGRLRVAAASSVAFR